MNFKEKLSYIENYNTWERRADEFAREAMRKNKF